MQSTFPPPVSQQSPSTTYTSSPSPSIHQLSAPGQSAFSVCRLSQSLPSPQSAFSVCRQPVLSAFPPPVSQQSPSTTIHLPPRHPSINCQHLGSLLSLFSIWTGPLAVCFLCLPSEPVLAVCFLCLPSGPVPSVCFLCLPSGPLPSVCFFCLLS
jgi:hypothetical protein